MSDQTDTADRLVCGTKMLRMIQWVMVNIFAGVADTTIPAADILAGLGQQRQENKAEFPDQYSTLSSSDEIVGSFQSADSSEIKGSPSTTTHISPNFPVGTSEAKDSVSCEQGLLKIGTA